MKNTHSNLGTQIPQIFKIVGITEYPIPRKQPLVLSPTAYRT